MEDRATFMNQFEQLEDSYQLLQRLGSVETKKSFEVTCHADSTESLKRKSTSRTGCSEIIHSLFLKQECEEEALEQTFCNIENVETANILEQAKSSICSVRVIVNHVPHTLHIPEGSTFERLLSEVEALTGSELSTVALGRLVQSIQNVCARAQLTPLKATPEVITPTKYTPSRPSNRERSKENRSAFDQATIVRNRKRMVLFYTQKSIHQDIEMLCITHKLPPSAKRLILKALNKGDKQIMLSI